MSKAQNTWTRAQLGWDSPISNPYYTKPNAPDRAELKHKLFIEMQRIRYDINQVNKRLSNGFRILPTL